MKNSIETVKSQSKQTNLANYNVATQLVDGKIIIVNDNGTYRAVKPFDGVTIEDNFDPADYALCWALYEEREYSYGLKWCNYHKKHTQQLINTRVITSYDCYRIGYAREAEAKQYKLRRVINQMEVDRIVNKNCNPCCDKSVYRLKPGDKIHIHSKNGIYEVVSIDHYFISITCKKWMYTDKPVQHIKKSDFKCLAGGLHNWSR